MASSDSCLLRSFLSLSESRLNQREEGSLFPQGRSTASDVRHACMYAILCMCVCILYVMAWLTFKDVLALAG